MDTDDQRDDAPMILFYCIVLMRNVRVRFAGMMTTCKH